MKYFAKYLPVEGEIKEGDSVVTITGFLKKYDETVALEAPTKVKLFLCSRDIQVGDKFTHKTGATETEQICLTIDKEKNLIQDGNHNFFMLHFCYKVIGEISSEATWVREGDEFEEEGIDFVPAVSDEDYKLGLTDKIFYMVKCPHCGTFK